MKICLLGDAQSIHFIKWANALSDAGHTIMVLTMHPGDSSNYNSNIQMYELPFKNGLGYYLNYMPLKRILRKLKPDILHVHYASGYGTLGRLVHYVPTILSVWGSDVYIFPNESSMKRKIIVRNLQSANLVLSTSHDMAKVTNELTTLKHEIVVTPFGIDTNQFQPKLRSKQTDTITIGMIKTFEKKYGPDLFIHAISNVIAKLKEEQREDLLSKLQVLCVGRGDMIDELKEQCNLFQINDYVDWIGPVPHEQVSDYLNQLDVYVAPSRSESFGVAVLEASACEVPVIVTNVGGLVEVVEEGKTGLVVESENVEALTNAIYSLILDKQLRKDMGTNGRNFVVERYEWKRCVEQMNRIYAQISNYM